MIKRVFAIIVVVLLSAYLVAAFTVLNKDKGDAVCKEVKIVFDNNDNSFITMQDVEDILKSKNLYPKGKKMNDIVCSDIEKELHRHELFEECQCYKTTGDIFCIKMTNRDPVLHVFSVTDGEFYVDRNGETMNFTNHALYLPIATGYITKEFAIKQIFPFVQYLKSNRFWEAQIEQINVNEHQEVELVPRVGENILFLGDFTDMDKKLENLKTFYAKGLNIVGWNKYSTINMEFDNQIICTKVGFDVAPKAVDSTAVKSETDSLKKPEVAPEGGAGTVKEATADKAKSVEKAKSSDKSPAKAQSSDKGKSKEKAKSGEKAKEGEKVKNSDKSQAKAQSGDKEKSTTVKEKSKVKSKSEEKSSSTSKSTSKKRSKSSDKSQKKK